MPENDAQTDKNPRNTPLCNSISTEPKSNLELGGFGTLTDEEKQHELVLALASKASASILGCRSC